MKKINTIIILLVSSMFVAYLSGCGGLNVAGLDLGKIATTSSRVITGNKLSERQQQQMGEQMTALLIGTSKLHADKNRQKYVNKVGRWVAMQAKSGHNQWQFIVIESKDFNAFSMPGGYVVISSGVLDRLSSEAELAAVLAHEIVHIEQKHQVKAIEKNSRWTDLGELAFTAVDYSQSQKGGYGQKDALKRKVAKEIVDVTQTLYTKGLGREDELDADRKAVVLMTRAGYDPYAYLTVMQIIESIDEKNKLLMLATHPKISERIEVANQALDYVTPHLANTVVAEKRFLKSVF